jgi:hypothetical protein
VNLAHDDLTLYPKRGKWIRYGLLGLVLTGGSVGVAIEESDLLGWAGVVLFGLATLVAGWSLVPGASYLQLSSDGFVAKGALRTHRYTWQEVTRFDTFSVYTQYTRARVVGFGLTERDAGPQSLWRRLNGGIDKSLPDTYGYDAADLVALMNGYRTKYAHGGDPRM